MSIIDNYFKNKNKVEVLTKEEKLALIIKKILKKINRKDKHKDAPKNLNMGFDEFISYSENMEEFAKHLGFKFVDYQDALPEHLRVDIPDSKSFVENNIYLLKEDNKTFLMVHDIRKLDLHEVANQEIEYEGIAIASRHTISILLGLKDEIDAEINEAKGAVNYINEIVSIAKLKKASEIYISLRSYSLVVRLRNYEGVFVISKKGIKEAEILRKWFEIKSDAREGAIFYDGMFRIEQDDYRINFQETYAGFRITIRVYQNEFKGLESLSSAGYTKSAESIIKEISLSQDGGMLFVAPTGQGKTTTQNILMNLLSEIGNEVISVENPVEKFLSKTDQVDMQKYQNAEGIHKITKTDFINNAMRSKADIIGIGELRDVTDYSDAKKVALTGHFFMGSTHTTSVKGTFERLKDNGWSELDIKSLIRGVVYQQLTRALCEHCKIEDEEHSFKKDLTENHKIKKDAKYYKANYHGCSKCFHGYKKTFTPIAEVARFPIFSDFKLYDTETYLDYISFVDDARTKFESGIIDFIHYHALENRVRMPFFTDFIAEEILEEDVQNETIEAEVEAEALEEILEEDVQDETIEAEVEAEALEEILEEDVQDETIEAEVNDWDNDISNKTNASSKESLIEILKRTRNKLNKKEDNK
ncbi:ATPase, T2SS/T4P/T4SS family [Poseidonibacter ostreae]|uniref:Bacterial type II secretion system protein E domain-containing protein n=1 Tax=Poseidonibacter ostreae TaxID=2654171 RepID=A0A6L4WWV6_9BACT|nr:ATPase, T2SS/T4P/T4SS family [Poseidonibacter ostreae]KAB7891325.1 hypothetical protein GBG19_00380 [Poseidonibacter ostreae]